MVAWGTGGCPALQTATERLEAGHGTALPYAMLSIYQQAAGRQLELRGALTVLLPPEVRPLGLAEALGFVDRHHPDRLPEAVWRVVRGAPPPRRGEPAGRRYPPALVELVGLERLAALDVTGPRLLVHGIWPLVVDLVM